MKRSWFQTTDYLKLIVVAFDFISFQVSLAIGYLLWVRIPWHGNWQYFTEFSTVMWILPPLAIIVFKAIGLYKPGMGVIGVQEQSLIFKGIWIIYFFLFAFTFFYRDIDFSRLATLYSMVVALFVVSTERYFLRHFFSYLNRKGIANRKAVVYGAGYHGVRLERWIRQTPQLGIKVLGYLEDNQETLNKIPKNPPIIGSFSDIGRLVEEENVSILFVAHQALTDERMVELIQIAAQLKINCWVIPSLYKFHIERVEVQHIGGIPLLGFKQRFVRRSYEFIKYVIDWFVACSLIVFSAPLWLTVGLTVWITSGAPIFFQQTRIGKNHKRFRIYKFRTMKKGRQKDAISPELQKGAKGSKLTPLGGFLRKTGLDEIPQLINVVRGEMSMVGPRPEMPFLVNRYGPLERERLTVRPGITGLWQISDDRKRLLIHENMDYDLYYVENMGFNLDLAILVKTAMAILKRVFMKDKKVKEKASS